MRCGMNGGRGMIGVLGLAALVGWAGAGNVVVNGDFEDPSLAGIGSDYVHTPNGNIDEGTWWVNPWDPGAPWHPSQHTPGGVAAMSVNGDNSAQAGEKRVWHQTVAVDAGGTYEMSVWALGTHAGSDGYSLRFAIDGQQVGVVRTPLAANTWEQHTELVTAPGSSVTISIVNVSGITFPNDFMLDDITFQRVTPACPWDLDGSGHVDTTDLNILLSDFGCSGGSCAGDIDGDGDTDTQDLNILLSQFGEDCPE